ncbi:amino acid efflux transporter [Amycolatopsis marina]|uniref:Amino acid efflux transporter n=1 Tax=Amycolatopsis marina TaxID=490629 RepID=A0A1I0ZJS8_9PSEU|nr:APC family permease [Amycolatopsis marina]SFB25707.1 amino acid efflux transporter [Amycolatopsis marina]
MATLRRSLGVPGLVIHYVTSVVGVGILILPGHAAAEAGPLSLLAWALLIIYSYPLALTFARLSGQYPSARGIAGFVGSAFGERAGRWVGAFLVLSLLIANPVLGLAAARYLLNMWEPDPSDLKVVLLGLVIMVGSILFNLFGVRTSSLVQGAVLVTLITFLVVVMIIAMPSADSAHLTPFAPHGMSSLGAALIVCFFGFIGWENAAPVAEEVVDPARTFRKAIALAVFVIGFLYLAMAATIVLVVPPGTAEGSQITAFTTLLRIVSGETMSQVGGVVAVVLLLLATNAWVLGTSRVIYSTAREGLLPAALTKISARRGVPYLALFSLIAGYGVPVGLLAVTGSTEERLITATSAAFLLIFLFTFLAAHRLLTGRGARACNAGVAITAAAMLPFFGASLVYAAVLMLLALLMVGRKQDVQTR